MAGPASGRNRCANAEDVAVDTKPDPIDHDTEPTRAPGFRIQMREVLLVGGPAVLLVLAAFWFAFQFVKPAPPSQIAITTGSEAGAYYAFGKQYAASLAEAGIKLEVRPSAGSVENLRRLSSEAPGERVDLALMQGGIADRKSAPGIISLGRIFLEPVWIFHRLGEPVDRLGMLKGKRIAVGGPGSGTRRLAEDLLSANDVNEANTSFLPLSSSAAVEALSRGEADAAFFTFAPESPLLQRLLREEALQLVNLRHAEAYTRRFPFLTHVVLPEGAIDLVRNLPRQDIHILAAQAALVARDDLPPALAGPIGDALRAAHAAGGMFHRVGDFPQSKDPEFPMSEDAERIYTSGPPFFQRFLPFWLASFIERMLIMAVPIATILLPLVKIVPMIYDWRIRSRLLYWYAQLKALERRIASAGQTTRIEALRREIDHIDEAVSMIPVPLHYSDRHYELRGAIDIVRQRILGRSQQQAAAE
ncbi:MAG: TAXI family TRAP transporter solute-binding subunit [Hyphomicrobiaceae bacterium]